MLLQEPEGVDFILADLGLSSMQIDNPERGFTFKSDGPLVGAQELPAPLTRPGNHILTPKRFAPVP